jgi:EmrB/QacA subfamily drug resistance transporter
MGAFGSALLLAPALGPLLAGWLVQEIDWRAFFLLNVPVGVVALALSRRALPALPTQGAAGPLDTRGAVLASLGCAAVSYGLSASANAGWSGLPTVAALIVGAGAIALFVAHALRTEQPLLELRVFTHAGFARAIVTHWLAYAALLGGLFLVPAFLQQVRGYGPFETGLALLPQVLAAALCMPLGGRLFDRFGARLPVSVGLGLVALSAWGLAQVTSTTSAADLWWPLALRGAGAGLVLMPLTTHLLGSAPGVPVSRLTALIGALQNVAGALGIATLVTVLQHQAGAHEAPHAGAVGLAAAFAGTFLVAAAMAVVSLLLSLTLRRPGDTAAPVANRERDAA